MKSDYVKLIIKSFSRILDIAATTLCGLYVM